MLTVSQFKKRYGSRVILDIPAFTFDHGVSWIKGENGSGKSTFLRALAGQIPFEGLVEISGRINLPAHPVEYRRRIGFSEAEPMYPGFITGKEIFAFVAKAHQAKTEQTSYYQSLFGIDSYFAHPCSTYSSGMLKKLSLSMSFLGAPSVIILDEPFITLDNAAVTILINEVNRLLSDRQILFLISSHQHFENTGCFPFRSFRIQNKTFVEE